MSNNDDLESLNSTIKHVSIVYKVKDLIDKYKKKQHIKNTFIIMSPSVLALLGFIAFPSMITTGLLLVGISSTGVLTLIIEHKESNNDSVSINFPEIEPLDDTSYIKPNIIRRMEEFNKIESEEENVKYDRAVEIQRLRNYKLRLIKENDRPEYLSKDDANKKVVYEISCYYKVYSLPPLNINPEDWDLFINSIYELLLSKGIEHRFYELLSNISKMTLSTQLIFKSSTISIEDFIDNLYELTSVTTTNITSDEIRDLRFKLLGNVNKQKVIEFSQYKKYSK